MNTPGQEPSFFHCLGMLRYIDNLTPLKAGLAIDASYVAQRLSSTYLYRYIRGNHVLKTVKVSTLRVLLFKGNLHMHRFLINRF